MSKGRGRRSDTLGTMHRKTEAKMEELKRISRRAYLYGSQGGSTMTGRLTTGAPPFQELPNADKEQTIAAFMDSYNKMKDFEQQRVLEKIAADEELIRSRGVYDQVPVLHPLRYPKHENGKGQLLGGFCNTTRCNNIDAVWFNDGTRGYYCSQCAGGINGFNSKINPCQLVDHMLTLEEMDARNVDYMNRGRATGW